MLPTRYDWKTRDRWVAPPRGFFPQDLLRDVDLRSNQFLRRTILFVKYLGSIPPARMPVANESVYRDSLVKVRIIIILVVG